MDNNFKDWLCKTAGYEVRVLKEDAIKYKVYFELDLLIHAMWAINRECRKSKNVFSIQDNTSLNDNYAGFAIYKLGEVVENKLLKKHNNSEQEALTAALQYIYKESTK